jgi:NAD(P)-dependent dehydrogenase (short-subunit alcohol dehydrogenase family)
MTRLLEGKVAVITGASSGLGRAMAIEFAAQGAKVSIGDLASKPAEGGEDTVDIIARAGGSATFKRTDIAAWEDVDALISEAVTRHGRLDVMINNAATFSSTGVLDTTAEQWDHVMRVNLTGMFYGCKRAVQQMITQEPRAEVRGRIINLGSQHGIICSPRDIAYGASKAGAIYLTRQIASDYADQLIVCNCISPGKIVKEGPLLPPDPEIENATWRTPWPRLGRPQDIANIAVHLASDRASYMTGSNVVVDGGWLSR